MIISEGLQQFYIQNNLSKDGGENDDYFHLTFRLFSLKIPNFNFRKKVVHIHDIQHVLYHKDITWKGEAFIAGWEIATGMWKYFPLGIMSLWAMGFSILNHPKEVLKGYKKGLLVHGLLDLKITKEKLLNYKIEDLRLKISKEKPKKFNIFLYVFWAIISVIIFCFPLIFLIFLLGYLFI